MAALVSVATNATHCERWEKGLDNSQQRRTTERWERRVCEAVKVEARQPIATPSAPTPCPLRVFLGEWGWVGQSEGVGRGYSARRLLRGPSCDHRPEDRRRRRQGLDTGIDNGIC